MYSALVPWGNLKYPNVKSTDLTALNNDVDQEVTWDGGTRCEILPQPRSVVFNDTNSHWTTSIKKKTYYYSSRNPPPPAKSEYCNPKPQVMETSPNLLVTLITPFLIKLCLGPLIHLKFPYHCHLPSSLPSDHWCWHWQAPVTSNEFWIWSTGLLQGRRGSLGFCSVSSSFPLI